MSEPQVGEWYLSSPSTSRVLIQITPGAQCGLGFYSPYLTVCVSWNISSKNETSFIIFCPFGILASTVIKFAFLRVLGHTTRTNFLKYINNIKLTCIIGQVQLLIKLLDCFVGFILY